MRYCPDSKHKNHANLGGHVSVDQKCEFVKQFEAKLISPAEAALWQRGPRMPVVTISATLSPSRKRLFNPDGRSRLTLVAHQAIMSAP